MSNYEYREIETFMLEKMNDSAHDSLHIYRVLGMALEIAAHESNVDYDILIAAALLHDIGREQQFKDANLDHAIVGGAMAYDYLMGRGWPQEKAERVKVCIEAHRYRKNTLPSSIEAKILFDADKLEASGAMGIARTFIYKGIVSEPLYALAPDGKIETRASNADITTFFQEFNYKLRNLYGRFHTAHANAVAEKRAGIALAFYDNLLAEVQSAHESVSLIENVLEG